MGFSVSAKTPLLLIGGGGHCAAVIDVIETADTYEVAGIVEADGVEATHLLGYPVLGTDSDLPELIKQTPDCVITLGQVGPGSQRRQLFKTLTALGARFPVVVSTHAVVSPRAQLGAGTVIMHSALVNAEATIGTNVIVNSQALVEHHAQVHDHVHIATGARINGHCCVGSESFVGSGAVFIQGVTVAPNTVIGAGAVLTESVSKAGVYLGLPAKRIREKI